ncbi:MAG: hypothetical protein HQL97_00255 [Magnetococcales bacterium]|nr:hypothetical protein [Magnetococcales bacterium]
MSETAIETEPNYEATTEEEPNYETLVELPRLIIDPFDKEKAAKALEEIEDADKLADIMKAYETEAADLTAHDNISLLRCAAFVETCKVAQAHAAKRREGLVGPLNAQVKKHNAVWMPLEKGFDAAWRKALGTANRYIAERDAAIEAEQRRLAAEAAAAQALIDQQQREAEEAAKKAAEEGDFVAAVELESKAEELRVQAAEIVPEVVPQESNKVQLDSGATLSLGGKGKRIWVLPGWDKKKALPALDEKFAGLVGDITKLPEGVQFLLSVCDVNPVHLNAKWKAPGAKFPRPFIDAPDYSKGSLR